MALVGAGGVNPFPDTTDLSLLGAASTFTFDGATDLLAAVLTVPATGTIANVHYRVNASASPVCTLRIELRTVSATTGQPNAAGTLYGSSTSITVSNPTTGNKTAAVNATGATAGDVVAVVFDLSAFTSGSFALTLTVGPANVNPVLYQYPYSVRNTTGSTALNAVPYTAFALEYSTHTYYPLGVSTIVGESATQNVNSTTPRAGNRIRSSVPRRAVGVWAQASSTTVDGTFKLRLASDDSILGTCTFDKDQGVAGSGYCFRYFDSGTTVNLAAGTDYYVLLEQSASASSDTIRYLQSIPETQQLDQLDGGRNCYGTTHNGTSYTDNNLTRFAIGVLYDQLDDGTGGAGVKYRVNMGMG